MMAGGPCTTVSTGPPRPRARHGVSETQGSSCPRGPRSYHYRHLGLVTTLALCHVPRHPRVARAGTESAQGYHALRSVAVITDWLCTAD
jgi:hypothetical protein